MIRIVNERGRAHETKFLDAETGEQLKLGVAYGVTITIDNGRVTASLPLVMLGADMTVSHAAWKTKNPVTGQFEPVASITFVDGTTVTFGDDGTPVVTTKA